MCEVFLRIMSEFVCNKWYICKVVTDYKLNLNNVKRVHPLYCLATKPILFFLLKFAVRPISRSVSIMLWLYYYRLFYYWHLNDCISLTVEGRNARRCDAHRLRYNQQRSLKFYHVTRWAQLTCHNVPKSKLINKIKIWPARFFLARLHLIHN